MSISPPTIQFIVKDRELMITERKGGKRRASAAMSVQRVRQMQAPVCFTASLLPNVCGLCVIDVYFALELPSDLFDVPFVVV